MSWRLLGPALSVLIHAGLVVTLTLAWRVAQNDAAGPLISSRFGTLPLPGRSDPVTAPMAAEPSEPVAPEPAFQVLPQEPILVPEPEPPIALPSPRSVPEPAERRTMPMAATSSNSEAVATPLAVAPVAAEPVATVAAAPAPSVAAALTPAALAPDAIAAPPSPIVRTPPDYPKRARRLGQEGVVVLQLVLHADGTVASVVITVSSASELLDEAAIAAVSTWRYAEGGEGREVSATIRFELR